MIALERYNRRAGGDPWPIYKGVVKVAALLLLAAAMSRGATCTSNANGPWSSPSSWTLCGGGIPQPGDTVIISGHTITLDTNATVVSVTVNLINSVFKNAPGAYTLTLTQSGGDCLIGRNKATIDLTYAVAGAELTVSCTAAGATFGAIALAFAAPFQGLEVLRLDHVIIDPGTAGIGVRMSNAFGGQTYNIQHTKFLRGAQPITQTSLGTNNTGVISYNTWENQSSANAVALVSAVGLQFTDNTDLNGTAQGAMLSITGDVSGLVEARNVVKGSGTVARRLHVFSSVTPTASPTISYNVGHGSETVPGTSSWAGGCLGTASFPCIYDHNVFQYAYNGISFGNYNNLSYNIGVQNSAASAGQGCFIALSKSDITSSFDSCLQDSSNGNIDILAITGARLTITNMLAHGFTPATGDPYNIAIGEGASGSTHHMTNVSVSNSISIGGRTGIGSVNPDNTFVTTGTGGVGVFNNSATGATLRDYYPNGVPSFGLSHPSATYGDVQTAPYLVSTTRRIADCDAILGGVGTTANFFAQMALRWNGTNQANYTPQALWNCMAAPLASQNVSYATAGFGGTFVGPYKPIIMVGSVQ